MGVVGLAQGFARLPLRKGEMRGHCFGLRRVHRSFSGHEKSLGKLLSAKALLAETEGFEPSCP